MQQVFYDFTAFGIMVGKKPLLVCDGAFDMLGINLPCEYTRFSGFGPNPRYEDILSGVKALEENGCGFIVAIGGGSSIDTAKAIKHYSKAGVPIMAVPTTSGTGSEATKFAALYKDGEKYSIENSSLLPDYVVLQPDTLKTLPVYQKKCTMLDALCQAIESWWSKRANAESIEFSRQSIRLITGYMHSYLANEYEGNKNMQIAANLAGKAINITTTTAPHAMSYKLTSLYGLPHGHAVALCLPKVWAYMGGFDDIANELCMKPASQAVLYFVKLLEELEIFPPKEASLSDIELLAGSVNEQRLNNNPAVLDSGAIRELYMQILEV